MELLFDEITTVLFQILALVVTILVFLDRRSARKSEMFRVKKEGINRDNAPFLSSPNLLQNYRQSH